MLDLAGELRANNDGQSLRQPRYGERWDPHDMMP